MSNLSRHEDRSNRLTSRWKTSHKAVATLLLSLLPCQAVFAGAPLQSPAAPATARQTRPAIAATAVTPREIVLFGPQKYVRTTGARDVYTATLTAPAWLAAPYRLHIQNGEADGSFRISSATVTVDGVTVLDQSDFKQSAASFDRVINVGKASALTVTLASQPTSYLLLSVYGTSVDYTAPKLVFAQPLPASTINTATPRLLVQYTDPAGTSEPAAAGVDIDTLKVAIDGVDRSSLFTRRSNEASAQLPSTLALAAGKHTLTASIADLAGNRSEVAGEFRVDLTVPTISVVEPAAASYLATRTPPIRIRYADETAIAPNTLRVMLGTADISALLTRTAVEAVVVWPAGSTAPEGPNQITATIQDLGGNEATATTSFNVDVKAPQIVIVQPSNGTRIGARDVTVKISYSDDQVVVPSSATLTVDGTAVTLTPAATEATAQLSALTDGTHALSARVLDRAGNATTATSTISIDTTVPKIQVVAPPAGAKLKTSAPDIALSYSDEQGVDVGSLKVTLNAVDRTTLFTRDNASAAARVSGFALPEGVNEIAAEIRDITANLGRTVSSFFVDTVAPTGVITAPGDRVITNAPTVTVQYADSGSGIDPTSVRLFVDAADRTSLLQATDVIASATLTMQPPLTDGAHEIKVTFGDRAGNLTTLAKTFVIDTRPPQLKIVAPANDAFLNTMAPALRVTYSDLQGTGVDTAAFTATLKRNDDPPKDVKAWFTTVSPLEATGIVPDADKLADGTYHLRARIADVAGNATTADASFEIDTVVPTYRFDSPAPRGYVASASPPFKLLYGDAQSGVDTSRITVAIDGVDLTSRFTFVDGVASGTLPSGHSLAQGNHTIEITLYDRAGNRAASGPQTFGVDTIAPTASVGSPLAGSFVAKAPHSFAVAYTDAPGSGVDPASVKVTIDGVDRTSSFTIGTTAATATVAEQLADGSHTLVVSVLDWAGNSATASSQFTVDAVIPVVKITAPLAEAWLKGPMVTVTGSVTDASPVRVEVNGIVSAVTTGAFTTSVPATDGVFTIRVIATDAAGNVGTGEVRANVDSLAPVITVSEPAATLITNKGTVRLAGTIADTSALTATLNGQPLSLTSNAFATDVPLTGEGANTFTIAATDAAGNSSTAKILVTRDTTAPVVRVASPVKSAITGTVPVVVRGTVADATAVTITVDGVAAAVTGDAWEASMAALPEGPRVFAVIARDAAGNITTASHDVTIDLSAPVVVISSPVAGALTKAATATITGTATDFSLVAVKIGGVDATLSDGSTAYEKKFTIAGVALAEGDNTIHVIATDAIARSTDKSILITRDSIPPTVTVAGPEQITRSRTARIIATAADNLSIKDVAFLYGTTELARLTETPYAYDFSAPATAAVGDTLTLTIVASDKAGNTTTVTKPLRLVAEGALTGQVLSDVTGQPVRGARVRLLAADPKETTTDERGRYAFPVNDQNVVLLIDGTINNLPTTPVERVVSIQSGTGTVPVDARLTPLRAAVPISSAGGQLVDGSVVVSVPGGAVATTTPMRVTRLSAQGLPNLLPLGWAPVAAFHVMTEGALAAPLPFTATVSSVTAPLAHLLFYNTTTHAWTMSQAGLAASGGIYRLTLPQPGAYVLAVTDDNSVPVAAAGALVAGLEMRPLPDVATSTGNVSPATLPPSGGSAVGTLIVKSPTPMPSGTVVQAEVTETFSLASGETASEETRTQDLVLNRSGADLAVSFPIVPSRTFAGSELVEGKVHLDILAGRESVRGKTGGGNQAVVLDGGTVGVTVPAGSLPNDVAISATPTILSSFLPATAVATPFAEAVLDFSGFTLSAPAQLSASAATVGPDQTVVVARVERINGIPRVVVVAAAQRVGNRFVSSQLEGFAGVRSGGRYVFYRLSAPWSVITGSIGAGASTTVVVEVAGLPFVALTNATGKFNIIALVGAATLKASAPGSALNGSATVSVSAGQTATVSFGLAPTVTTATVTPLNGALRVPVSVQVEIIATAPLNRLTTSGVQLRSSAGQLVPVSYLFSGSGRVLALVPLASLAPGQTYTLSVNGLADSYGGMVAVAPVSFTTQPDTPPSYDTNRIIFTMPDTSGNVTVSAPAGSLPPGTRVMIVNSGNGVVVSYTVGNDGAFTGQFPATTSDRLLVTVSDPRGNVVNFEKSKYVATDGSGRVAIGPAGGTVEGPGGVALIIPDGALAAGAVFKVEPFGPTRYSERPDLPGAKFGSGLTITNEQKVTLKTEGKLVFPRPADAPEGAFFYVYKRMTGPNGMVGFQTIDYALPDGKGSVVTASYPFIGWNDSVSSWEWTAEMQNIGFGVAADVVMYLMWSFDAMIPGIALPGVISGKILRPVYKAGATEPEYVGVAGALVIRAKENGQTVFPTFAVSQSDGTYTVWDYRYTGGTVSMIAAHGGSTVTGTAFQANPLDTKSFFTVLYQKHRHVANLNLTLPAQTAPPVAPDIRVHLMTVDATGKRHEVDGIAISHQPLTIGFKIKNGVNAEVRSATIAGEELSVRRDTPAPNETLRMDWIVSAPWIPTAAGSYNMRAVALNALGGQPIEVDYTFLVTAGTGTRIANIAGIAPDWITGKLVPKQNEIAVPLDALPQVVFTEPVTNVLAGVNLSDSSGNASITISAVAVDDQYNQYAVADLRNVAATTPIVSITVRPLGGLKINAQYTLALSGAIQDLDKNSDGTANPRSFPGRALKFVTIAPERLASATGFDASRLIILGSHAYVAERNNRLLNTRMSVWSLNDPSAPALVGSAGVSGQAIDVSGELSSSVNDGEPAVIVGSGLKMTVPGPSNLYLFDVRRPEQPQRMAVVSLTEGPQQGTVLRVLLHGRYAYTVTYPHGVQVVDLKKAIELHTTASLDSRTRYEMSLAMVSEGVGFGQAAVVNSIPVQTINGQFNRVSDIAADEYIIGGVQKTLIIATGVAPLLVIDPADGGSSALKVTTLPSSTAGSLRTGVAVALTNVANRRVAVIAGTGTPTGAGEGPMLAVVDITDPSRPVLIGAAAVAGAVTDVVVNGERALVATASSTFVFSINDPFRPRFVGTIDDTGGRIAIDSGGGVVIGNSRGGVTNNGFHTALFHPVLIIDRLAPLNVKPAASNGSPAAAQKVVVADTAILRVRALPASIARTVQLRIANRSFPNTAGQPQTPHLVFDGDVSINQQTGVGEFTIAAGRALEDTELVANATATTTTGGQMKALPRMVKLGWVKVTVDSNNNTKIDEDDREAARKGRAFGFWESDRSYELKRVAANPKGFEFPDDDPKKGLADYFTVRITVNKPWLDENGIGTVRLRLGPDGPPTSDETPLWFIVPKLDPEKDYLRSEVAATRQVAEIVGSSPAPDSIDECAPSNGKLIEATTECKAPDGALVLPPELTVGDHDFLVRCANCMNRDQSNLNNVPKIWLEYVNADASAVGTKIDEAKADIRPVRQWITYMNARPYQGDTDLRPLPLLDGESRPEDAATGGDFEPVPEQREWANNASPWKDTETKTPQQARDVTVIVHGYKVADGDMRNKFLPTVMKRLYWVGHPILRTQGDWRQTDDAGEGCVKNCAHAIGISWPSNFRGGEPAEGTPVLRGLRDGLVAGLMFPEDEFRAFASGPAIAKYLSALNRQLPTRKTRLIAHSLGNLAVNSALTRPEMAGTQMVDRYVMNEAALPAEAMSTSYVANAQELLLWGVPHVQVYGFPDDGVWRTDWPSMETSERERWARSMRRLEQQAAGGLSINDREFYERRWTQSRTPGGPPDIEPVVKPGRGPWKGIFDNNKNRVNRLFNTYSANDQVLTVIYRVNQREQKPLDRGRLLLSLGPRLARAAMNKAPERNFDNASIQLWALADRTDTEWNGVFGDAGEHWTIKRQWAELSYWFPATSVAAGATALNEIPNQECRSDYCNREFTKYSKLDNPPQPSNIGSDFLKAKDNAYTHSYLGFGRLYDVYPAFDEIRKMFDPKN